MLPDGELSNKSHDGLLLHAGLGQSHGMNSDAATFTFTIQSFGSCTVGRTLPARLATAWLGCQEECAAIAFALTC